MPLCHSALSTATPWCCLGAVLAITYKQTHLLYTTNLPPHQVVARLLLMISCGMLLVFLVHKSIKQVFGTRQMDPTTFRSNNCGDAGICSFSPSPIDMHGHTCKSGKCAAPPHPPCAIGCYDQPCHANNTNDNMRPCAARHAELFQDPSYIEAAHALHMLYATYANTHPEPLAVVCSSSRRVTLSSHGLPTPNGATRLCPSNTQPGRAASNSCPITAAVAEPRTEAVADAETPSPIPSGRGRIISLAPCGEGTAQGWAGERPTYQPVLEWVSLKVKKDPTGWDPQGWRDPAGFVHHLQAAFNERSDSWLCTGMVHMGSEATDTGKHMNFNESCSSTSHTGAASLHAPSAAHSPCAALSQPWVSADGGGGGGGAVSEPHEEAHEEAPRLSSGKLIATSHTGSVHTGLGVPCSQVPQRGVGEEGVVSEVAQEQQHHSCVTSARDWYCHPAATSHHAHCTQHMRHMRHTHQHTVASPAALQGEGAREEQVVQTAGSESTTAMKATTTHLSKPPQQLPQLQPDVGLGQPCWHWGGVGQRWDGGLWGMADGTHWLQVRWPQNADAVVVGVGGGAQQLRWGTDTAAWHVITGEEEQDEKQPHADLTATPNHSSSSAGGGNNSHSSHSSHNLHSATPSIQGAHRARSVGRIACVCPLFVVPHAHLGSCASCCARTPRPEQVSAAASATAGTGAGGASSNTTSATARTATSSGTTWLMAVLEGVAGAHGKGGAQGRRRHHSLPSHTPDLGGGSGDGSSGGGDDGSSGGGDGGGSSSSDCVGDGRGRGASRDGGEGGGGDGGGSGGGVGDDDADGDNGWDGDGGGVAGGRRCEGGMAMGDVVNWELRARWRSTPLPLHVTWLPHTSHSQQPDSLGSTPTPPCPPDGTAVGAGPATAATSGSCVLGVNLDLKPCDGPGLVVLQLWRKGGMVLSHWYPIIVLPAAQDVCCVARELHTLAGVSHTPLAGTAAGGEPHACAFGSEPVAAESGMDGALLLDLSAWLEYVHAHEACEPVPMRTPASAAAAAAVPAAAGAADPMSDMVRAACRDAGYHRLMSDTGLRLLSHFVACGMPHTSDMVLSGILATRVVSGGDGGGGGGGDGGLSLPHTARAGAGASGTGMGTGAASAALQFADIMKGAAEASAGSSCGRSLLHVAVLSGCHTMVALVLAWGQKYGLLRLLEVRDVHGATALDLAGRLPGGGRAIRNTLLHYLQSLQPQ